MKYQIKVVYRNKKRSGKKIEKERENEGEWTRARANIRKSHFQRCGNVVYVWRFFGYAFALRTFHVHAINFRLQHGWTDHYQYRKWNETTTTYDNNLPPFREWNQEQKSKNSIICIIHTHKWRIETRREVKRNNIDSTANVVATKAHISFWDIETSLSFEIVGWKTTTAGYYFAE